MQSDSAVRQVAALKVDETYSRAKLLTGSRATPRSIRDTKRNLIHLLSPVVARAQKLSLKNYQLRTIHAFTSDYDVVMAAIIT